MARNREETREQHDAGFARIKARIDADQRRDVAKAARKYWRDTGKSLDREQRREDARLHNAKSCTTNVGEMIFGANPIS